MAADEYIDNGADEYGAEEEELASDEDTSLWDLTGIYHAADDAEVVDLPDSVRSDRRKGNRDRRSGPFTDRRRGDRRRRVSRSPERDGTQSADPMNIYLREMGSLKLLSHKEELKLAQMIEEGKFRIQNGVLSAQLAMPVLRELVAEIQAERMKIYQLLAGIAEDRPDEIRSETEQFVSRFEAATDLDQKREKLIAELADVHENERYDELRSQILAIGGEISLLFSHRLICQECIDSMTTAVEELSRRFRQVLVKVS
jgi:RNA polymerase primary sigma factor